MAHFNDVSTRSISQVTDELQIINVGIVILTVDLELTRLSHDLLQFMLLFHSGLIRVERIGSKDQGVGRGSSTR